MLGFILLDKPAELSSFDCIRKLRRLLNIRRMGHAGTLDPIATGLLIIAVGEATKLLSLLEYEDKTYEVTIHLGAVSETYDREGSITPISNIVPPTEEQIQEVLQKYFSGQQWQTPPLFSAIQVEGQRAYQVARKGGKVELKSRLVNFYSTHLVSFKWPLLKIAVRCSKGTYIRSMAHDLGQYLGCGGYVEELRRTAIGGKKVDDAVTLEKLSSSPTAPANQCIIPPEKFLTEIPHVTLNLQQYQHLGNGGFLPFPDSHKSYLDTLSTFSSLNKDNSRADNNFTQVTTSESIASGINEQRQAKHLHTDNLSEDSRQKVGSQTFLAIFQGQCVGLLEVFQGKWLKFQKKFQLYPFTHLHI